MSDRGKLGNFLKEVISWNWADFCKAEKDPQYKGYQAAVFALVRTCSDGKLGAIRLAIDRVDGKIETPIKVEYPKVWLLYPEAKTVAELSAPDSPALLPAPEDLGEEPPKIEEKEQSAAILTLRQTLEKMANEPRIVIQLILKRKKEIEKDLDNIKDGEEVENKIPLVKSVIAANLLDLAEQNNFEAITEVFDQIDGKLVETIKILGDDIYLTQYALEAPAGSVKNKDGVYMLEAKELTKTWKQRLSNN